MTAPLTPAERVVVVGYGPVAARLIDDLLPALAAGRISLLVVGAEQQPAYNRVLVADLGVGRTSWDAMQMSDPHELKAAGADVRTGCRATHIDRARRRITLDDGSCEPYDRLILATGSRANVPNLHGLNPDPTTVCLPAGITALRDLADATRLQCAVRRRDHVVVLGAGILGLEAALAAAEEGATVTVVYHGTHPLGRSLDRTGGSVLAQTLKSRGITLKPKARSTGVTWRHDEPGRRFRALVLDDGSEVEGDLLLISCGVRPRVELAAGCGLETARGVRVNHRLAADPEERIFAIGDCADIRCREQNCAECAGAGGPSGLIGPGWNQASWLANYLGAVVDAGATAGVIRSEAFAGVVNSGASAAVISEPLEAPKAPIMLLKARDVELSAAGAVDLEPWDEESLSPLQAVADQSGELPAPRRVAQWIDPENGRYVKIVSAAGIIQGFVCIGMPRTGAELVLLFERGADLPPDKSTLFRLDGAETDIAGGAATKSGPETTICRCSGATLGVIEAAVTQGSSSVESLGRTTRAGTGCGSCKEKLVGIIEDHFAKEPLAEPGDTLQPIPV
ncbi:FAD-dependent oxidoreductase [Arthrobacter castelli]|uniref:FAD-dependent oxidoreductase n=1 Tax=Arthrobacter castelli TaxID=271431 RepID=UPI0004287581|nr:FAD-dependent oxidoreductase [Arthrobacter castelli]